ncbi:LSU ribosomal protein L21P [Nitrosospira sp. Nsp2]|nr:LSU ribosomal protein L21P [Nitrosospira sp. Nsp2]
MSFTFFRYFFPGTLATYVRERIQMYAIIKTGGKQYRVENGLKLKIEQIPADIGSEVVIDQVLLISDGDNISMGKPVLSGASVTATVLKQGRHDKIRIFKMRRRKHYQKHQGHRQNYTEIEIKDISA